MFRRLLPFILVALFAGTAVALAASHTAHARHHHGPSSTGSDPLLVGNATVQSQHDSSAPSTEAFAYTATVSGTATNLNAYLDSRTGVKLGLYSDASSKPGTLLDSGSVTSNAAGWVQVPLTGGVQITAGTRYWIAIAPNGSSTPSYRDTSGGSNLDYTGSGGLPATFTTNGHWSSDPASAYVGGNAQTTSTTSTSTTTSTTTSTSTSTSTTTTTPTSTTTTTSTTSSTGGLPMGVTLQAIDGDTLTGTQNASPGYYCSTQMGSTVSPSNNAACLKGWDSPSFIPIGVYWGDYTSEESTWATLKWNTAFRTASSTDQTNLDANHIFSLPINDNSNGLPDTGPGPYTVGYLAEDEPECWSSPTCGGNGPATIGPHNSPAGTQDGKFWWVNNTWNMMVFGPPASTPGGTDSAFFSDTVTTPGSGPRYLNIGSIDEYWMSGATSTSGNSLDMEGGKIYNIPGSGCQGINGNGCITTAQARCGCRYGDMIRPVYGTTVGMPAGTDQSSWQTANPAPLFAFIEDSNPYADTGATNPTPPEINWSVWSSLIHGARGIIYFDHDFAGSCVSDDFVTSSCAQSPYPGQTVSVDTQIATTDTEANTFATELNSPTALGYVSVSPAPTTFGGIETRAIFDTNPSDCAGQTSCFYIMADTRDAETSTNISATFTIAGNYSGTIPYTAQDGTGASSTGTVTVSGNQFTDTFRTGADVRIYGPIPND